MSKTEQQVVANNILSSSVGLSVEETNVAKTLVTTFPFSLGNANRAKQLYEESVLNIVALAAGFSKENQEPLLKNLERDLSNASGPILFYQQNEIEFIGFRQPLMVSVKGSGFRKEVHATYLKPKDTSSHMMAWSVTDNNIVSVFFFSAPQPSTKTTHKEV